MKKIISIIVTLLTSFFTYSQQFESGQIIKNGKSIEGFIKYEDWLKSPKIIEFKRLKDDKPEIIEADSIDGFSVHGEEYIAKKVLVALSLNTPRYVDTPYTPVMMDGFYFLQVGLKNPKINIYEMIDAKEESHYFIEKEDVFQELFYSKQELYTGKLSYIQEKKGYLGQLTALLADCSGVTVSESLSYQKKEILDLCVLYLACKGEKYEQVSTNVSKGRISISVGLSGGKLLTVENKANWFWGANIRMNLPKHFRNNYVLLEGLYYRIRATSGSYANYNFKYALEGFGVNILIGTHFGTKNLRPFANVGVAFIPFVDATNNGILGVGLSWKRSLKIEYREGTANVVRQVSLGYLLNF